MICKRDTDANSFSVSSLVHLLKLFHLLRRSPWFQYGIIPSFRPPHPYPTSSSPLIPMLQTADRASYPTSPLAAISVFSHLVFILFSVVARWVYSPLQNPNGQRRVYSYISSSILTLPKKLRVHHSLRLICFCNPKSFLDLQRVVYPHYHVGWLVHLIPYHGGVGRGAVV